MHVAERYLRSIQSSDLRQKPEGLCDADTLISAGWASQKGRRRLAMTLYRIKSTGERIPHEVINELEMWVIVHAKRGKPVLHLADTVKEAIAWWYDPVCRPCNGLGHPVIPGTPTLSEADCTHCRGTGKRPMGQKNPELGQWLIGEIEHQISMVHDRMKRTLR